MGDREAVSFALPRPLVVDRQNSVPVIARRLWEEFESALLLPTSVVFGKLGHAYFSVPLGGGNIGVTVWPERNPNGWQIWILYSHPKASLRIARPHDLDEKLERAKRTVTAFLSATEAQEIRWMTIEEAGEMLAQ